MLKRVCFVPPLWLPVPNVKGGAIETLITNLIDENEIEKRFQFTVISIYDEEAEMKSLNYKHTKFIYIRKTLLSRLLNKSWRLLRKIIGTNLPRYYEYFALRKVKNGKFDFVIAEGNGDGNFKYLLKKYEKKRLLAHVHHHRLADEYTNEVFGNIIAISEYVKKEWIRTSINKDISVKVLINGVDINKFEKDVSSVEKNNLRRKYNFSNDDFVLIFCGRIIKEKGVLELVKAIESIEDENIKLLIVGSSNFAGAKPTEYVEKVYKLAEVRKGKIQLSGYIDNSDLYKYYKIADAMVVPSIWEEAAGLVCIEAMASRVPLIVSRSGGMIEYATSDVAIIVDKDKNLVNNIADAVVKLKNDKDLYFKLQNNESNLVRRFSSTQYYNNFVKLIDDVSKQIN